MHYLFILHNRPRWSDSISHPFYSVIGTSWQSHGDRRWFFKLCDSSWSEHCAHVPGPVGDGSLQAQWSASVRGSAASWYDWSQLHRRCRIGSLRIERSLQNWKSTHSLFVSAAKLKIKSHAHYSTGYCIAMTNVSCIHPEMTIYDKVIWQLINLIYVHLTYHE